MDAFRLTVPDLLVHGSNLILLFAYTRREMLSLRILALVAAVTIIPYYVLQPTVLWPPLLWSGVYGLVHSYHIVVLLLQRRPVELTPDEERLHAMSLSSLERGEFKRVMRFCTWRDAAPGTRFETGSDTVLLLMEGRVDAVLHGDRVSAFEPGDLLGIAFALAGAPGLELEAATPVRVASWSRAQLEAEMEKSPNIDLAFGSLLKKDLVSKVIEFANELRDARTS